MIQRVDRGSKKKATKKKAKRKKSKRSRVADAVEETSPEESAEVDGPDADEDGSADVTEPHVAADPPPEEATDGRESADASEESEAPEGEEAAEGRDSTESSSTSDSENSADEASPPESSQSPAADEEPERLEGDRLKQVLEALLFASPEALSLRRLNRMLKEAKKADIEEQLLALEGELALGGRGYGLVLEGAGYRLLTRTDLAPYVARLRGERKRIRLSKAAFETLAIIAYRQPIRRADLDAIRGVQSGTIVKNLLEWNLVRVIDRDEEIGRALRYGTTEEFLDQFGIADLGELPDPSAFHELGAASGVEVGLEENDRPAAADDDATDTATADAAGDPEELGDESANDAVPVANEPGDDVVADSEAETEEPSSADEIEEQGAKLEAPRRSDAEEDSDAEERNS
ncbi:MAG: SMC-Scp complex subunit ScpB [Planctomycetota bacterium]